MTANRTLDMAAAREVLGLDVTPMLCRAALRAVRGQEGRTG